MDDADLSALKDFISSKNDLLEINWFPKDWMIIQDDELERYFENPDVMQFLEHVEKEAQRKLSGLNSRLAKLIDDGRTDVQRVAIEAELIELTKAISYARRLIKTGKKKPMAFAFFLLGVQVARANDLLRMNSEALAIKAAYENKKKQAARKAVNARHDKPGGSRDLANKICEIWAKGNYSSRRACAEHEWKRLGFGSFGTAQKALRGSPDPGRSKST